MHNTNFFLTTIVCILFLFSCGSKDPETKASPDVNVENGNIDNSDFSEDSNVKRNMPEIVEDLRRDIKNLKAELDYQHENLTKLEAQTQVFANPFAIADPIFPQPNMAIDDVFIICSSKSFLSLFKMEI